MRSLQNQHRQMRNELFDHIGCERGLQSEEGSKVIVTRSGGNFQVRVKVQADQGKNHHQQRINDDEKNKTNYDSEQMKTKMKKHFQRSLDERLHVARKIFEVVFWDTVFRKFLFR